MNAEELYVAWLLEELSNAKENMKISVLIFASESSCTNHSPRTEEFSFLFIISFFSIPHPNTQVEMKNCSRMSEQAVTALSSTVATMHSTQQQVEIPLRTNFPLSNETIQKLIKHDSSTCFRRIESQGLRSRGIERRINGGNMLRWST